MIISSKEPSLFYPTRVLAWRLEEEAPRLLALCREAGIDVGDLKALLAKRQREKAAERLLLRHAFGSPVSLSYTEQGAPYIEGCDVDISITHTQQLVAIALNDEHIIGIDAEQMCRQQVLRVRDKYLNAAEQQFVAPDDLTAHVIAWTAKEAVIKATRDRAIDWTHGICLDPFTPDAAETAITARCNGKIYRLTSRPIDGHHVTVAVESSS